MDDRKQIVRRFLDAAERGDGATMEALLHTEVEVLEAASLPWAGVHRGLKGFQLLARRVFGSFRETRVVIRELLADSDRVVVIADLTGRSRRDGGEFSMPVIELWEFEGTRIRRITPFYFDTKALLALLPDESLRSHEAT